MKNKKIFKQLAVITAGALAVAGISIAGSSAAVTSISLNSTNNFGLVVGGGLTNAGQSTINGDLALAPVISYVDTGLLTLKGAYHFGDAAAVAAQAGAATAYGLAAVETPTVVVASELAGQTLLPGIYTNVAGLSVNGTVNLDAQNNSGAIFVLQTPLALTTGASSHINLVNGAQACNVFWQVGTTSSLGTSSDFKGNLLGKGNFASAAGTVVQGRVLIAQGSASLNATTISRPECKASETPPVNNHLSTGGGAYVSPFGNSNFNFEVKGTDIGNTTFASIGGKVSWNAARSWKFNGVPSTYSYVNGAGTITGTGSLSYFATQKKGKDGRWVSATTGSANFTVNFTRVINANGTVGKVNTFAIGFTGTTSTAAPQLPVLGALVQVKGGGEGSNG